MFPGINPNAVSGSKRPGAPCSPIVTSIVFTATSATVTVSPPDHNGGAYIRSYVVVSNPGNLIGAGSNPNNIIVSGLTPNTNYNFTAYAVNEISSGTVSIPSGIIKTLTDIPTAPTGIIAAASGSTSATISYTQSSSDNGLTITSYTAVSTPGGITASTSTSASSTIYVTGLSVTTGYTFQVYATNSKGNSPYSAASNSITTFAVVPNAPTIGTASIISGNQISVSYTPPAYNGGSAITSYTAISNPGGVTASAASGNIVFSISNLIKVTTYTFTVYATNAIGNSAVSGASNSVTTPATVPGAPTISSVSLTAPTSITVAYNAPADDGGAAITSYTAISTPGSISATAARAGGGTIVVTGLSYNTSYYFRVYATNSIGAGANSSTSSYVATWGSAIYATSGKSDLPNTYSWVAPQGVASVSVVAVGAAGGEYTGLGTARNSWFCNVNLVSGAGPTFASLGSSRYQSSGGTYVGDGGGSGGNGGFYTLNSNLFHEGAGGGAGGYTAAGGAGANGRSGCTGGTGSDAVSGGGGGGGGANNYPSGRRDGGGGVGLYGLGLTGAAGGKGGSGGGDTYGTCLQGCGGNYGGGGGAFFGKNGYGAGGGGGLGWKNNITVTPGQTYTVQVGARGADSRCRGGAGAVRIVWPASSAAGNRTFPSTNVSTP